MKKLLFLLLFVTLGTLTDGGSVKTPIFYNGTNWVSH